MEIIETLLYIVVIVAAILLILLTLVQSNKGSDLGLFGGSTEMVFGSQKGNILTRITAILATIVLTGAFLMSVVRVYLLKEAKDILLQDQKQQIKTLDELNKPVNPQTDSKPADNKQTQPAGQVNQKQNQPANVQVKDKPVTQPQKQPQAQPNKAQEQKGNK